MKGLYGKSISTNCEVNIVCKGKGLLDLCTVKTDIPVEDSLQASPHDRGISLLINRPQAV